MSSALLRTVVGATTSGISGQRLGRCDSLRVMAIFNIIAAVGCALNWTSLIFFRFIGVLGIGGSSVAAMMGADFFLILQYYPETKGISLEQMQHRFAIGGRMAVLFYCEIERNRLQLAIYRSTTEYLIR